MNYTTAQLTPDELAHLQESRRKRGIKDEDVLKDGDSLRFRMIFRDAAPGTLTMDAALQSCSSELRTKLAYAQSALNSGSAAVIEDGIRNIEDLRGRITIEDLPGQRRRLTTDSAAGTQISDYLGGLVDGARERIARLQSGAAR